MKNQAVTLKKQLLTALFAFMSMLSIATARFERDPQSCGMLVSYEKKKKE